MGASGSVLLVEGAHCYAADLAKRWGFDLWDNDEFRFLSEDNWRKPLRWNREAAKSGWPRFVFVASMCDIFQDHPLLEEPRQRVWELIEQTPWLTYQLLTKRPENIARMLPWDEPPPWVWLGTSVETARQTFRVNELIKTPASVHFISAEPLLGSLFRDGGNREPLDVTKLRWVVVGGESGPRFRPMNLTHARELRDACREAGVPLWFKQHSGRFPRKLGHLLDGVEHFERPQPHIPNEQGALF